MFDKGICEKSCVKLSRRCVLVRSRSLGLVSSSASSEHASTRTTRPHVPTCRVMRVCRQKPPAVLAGGVFELGGMGGFIAAAPRLPQPDLQ
ncbi:hypothetical protein T08_9305 [Trichinella sp. T8]|nr:hypothetical protein T08_9305 [Trichinella sp. T8]